MSWYEILVRGHAQSAARAARLSAGGAGSPSLNWIDGLIVILSPFVVLELIGGAGVAIAAEATTARIAAVAGAVFGATILLALIAVLRLLQAIERNTRPVAVPPSD